MVSVTTPHEKTPQFDSLMAACSKKSGYTASTTDKTQMNTVQLQNLSLGSPKAKQCYKSTRIQHKTRLEEIKILLTENSNAMMWTLLKCPIID
jgi:hypothetical protein